MERGHLRQENGDGPKISAFKCQVCNAQVQCYDMVLTTITPE